MLGLELGGDTDRRHGGTLATGCVGPAAAASASSTAATVGRRSAPARVAANTWRAGAGARSGRMTDGRPGRPPGASRGTSATPSPAATSAIVVWKSSDRCANAGVKPAAAQPVTVTSWQDVPSGGPTNGSSASSASAISARAASGWPAGTTASSGSARSGAAVEARVVGRGAWREAIESAMSASPRASARKQSGASCSVIVSASRGWVARSARGRRDELGERGREAGDPHRADDARPSRRRRRPRPPRAARARGWRGRRAPRPRRSAARRGRCARARAGRPRARARRAAGRRRTA